MTAKPVAFLDIECYRNFFLVKFKIAATGKYLDFVMWPGSGPLNVPAITLLLQWHRIVTFNGQGYDMPILALALSGASNYQLKQANDAIIVGGLKYWDFYEQYGIGFPFKVDHVDVMDVLPGVRISLKTYGGIMHAPTIQDLPVDPAADVTMLERVGLIKYCGNDLDTTELAYQTAADKEWISLRETISAEYGIDVMSKSDAQISEAIIKSQLGFYPDRRTVPDGFQFLYQMPSFISFKTPQLQDVQRIVASSPFTINPSVAVVDADTGDIEEYIKKTGIKMHPDVAKIRVTIGGSVYKFGAGGLHSQEKSVCYRTDDEYDIDDADVGSFYSRTIINQRLYPKQCGPKFLDIYERIFHERISAKRAKRKREADSKKIVLNGAFGKLGSKYSIFYAPELLMQVTISGQLLLLMLIEDLELNGISVVSANTDGIVTRTPKRLRERRLQIMRDWEQRVQMELEHTHYRVIALRDVNNYVAITLDGDIKRKGVFTKPEVGSGPSASKAPHREICADAVIAYVKDGTPIEHTIYQCRDVRKFVSVRNVKGGAVQYAGDVYKAREPLPEADMLPDDMIYVGKTVRWLYRREYDGALHYKSNGNQVADSTGAWPTLTLPDRIPAWLDREYYVRHARRLLTDCGLH